MAKLEREMILDFKDFVDRSNTAIVCRNVEESIFINDLIEYFGGKNLHRLLFNKPNHVFPENNLLYKGEDYIAYKTANISTSNNQYCSVSFYIKAGYEIFEAKWFMNSLPSKWKIKQNTSKAVCSWFKDRGIPALKNGFYKFLAYDSINNEVSFCHDGQEKFFF